MVLDCCYFLYIILFINPYFIFCSCLFFTDIREWLKSLRLHKYTKLILEYTYEEFLDLTDETLEKRNVTLGARGKIIKNIGLVKYRPQKLNEMAKELEVDISLKKLFSLLFFILHFFFPFSGSQPFQ